MSIAAVQADSISNAAGGGGAIAGVFGDGSKMFREYAMKEPHPLAQIQAAVLAFLQNRDDSVLFCAQAVNAYVDEPRMALGMWHLRRANLRDA